MSTLSDIFNLSDGTPYPAPRCPECGGRLEVLREHLVAPWLTKCEHGHICDATFDHTTKKWEARLSPGFETYHEMIADPAGSDFEKKGDS